MTVVPYPFHLQAAVTSAFINVTVDLNESVHCLHLNVRLLLCYA